MVRGGGLAWRPGLCTHASTQIQVSINSNPNESSWSWGTGKDGAWLLPVCRRRPLIVEAHKSKCLMLLSEPPLLLVVATPIAVHLLRQGEDQIGTLGQPTSAVALPRPSRASTSRRAPSSSPVPATAPKSPAGLPAWPSSRPTLPPHRERGRHRFARGVGKGLAAAGACPCRRAATTGAGRRRRRRATLEPRSQE
jgi:hypothetical protein